MKAIVDPENKPVEDRSLLEQMGGWQGLVSTTLPILVLVPVNSRWGLGPALVAALGVAFLILIWRLVRKVTIQPAISGFIGVAFCAAIAWITGDAKGYFLYGIWASLVFAVIALLSVLFKWPVVGVIWKGINGENMAWRRVSSARRCYSVATLGWVVIFLARFFIQNNLYASADVATLGIVRILMGWPLTGVVTILTIWMVRQANKAVEAAAEDKEHIDASEYVEVDTAENSNVISIKPEATEDIKSTVCSAENEDETKDLQDGR